MKHPVIAMKLHGGETCFVDGTIGTANAQLRLPKGCTGILFCFESKKAAQEYWGKKVPTRKYEKEDIK